jgi:transcriptional regulator with XRE-family HTH domain
MSEDDLPLEGFLLRYLRRRRGWSQARLATASGLSEAQINHFELGRRLLRPKRLTALTRAMGYSDFEVRLYRLLVEGGPRGGEAAFSEIATPLSTRGKSEGARQFAAEHGVGSAHDLDGAFQELLAEAAGDALRREGARAFRLWVGLPRAEQRFLVEQHPHFQTLAVIEQICLASERSAAKDPKLPLHFSQMALLAAERVAGPLEVRSLARGYALAFVSNAKRVGVGLRDADEDFRLAERWWAQGAEARHLFFEAWRLPDLKASLRRDQRRWKESLALSDQALAEAPPSARGRILVKKAAALEPMGQPEEAIQALVAATPYVEASGDRDILLVLWINLAVNLTHVGKWKEARQHLAEARKLAVELGRDLHLTRCTWIAGRIAGESGDHKEAVASLEQARGDFTVRQMPLEAAAVALDEAVYLLQADKY